MMAKLSPSPDPKLDQPTSHLAPFIGRQSDLKRILDLFEVPSTRLITILGPGGIGKTRLALELADRLQNRFQYGAIFIPLAQMNTGNKFLPALAERLGVQLPPGGDLMKTVLNHLSGRQMLLILDNFEHLLDEAVLVHDILVAGPQVKVLATSREKLGLEVETLYHLEGLELPPLDDLSSGNEFDAVQLFLQKARQVRPGFSLDTGNTAAVIQICRLVDSNALGILLAAAWVEHFSPEEIINLISKKLGFLSSNMRDTEPRHSSMRTVFESSLNRLDDVHKAAFRKLAVFRGGFNLDAAKAVAGADLQALISLMDKSLLARNPDTGRYDLHELLRQYAGEELVAAGESKNTLEAHAAYFTAFVQEREAVLISPSQTKALDEIQADFDNIREAFSTAIGERDFDAIRTMLLGLYKFCDMRSRAYEGEILFRLARDGLAPKTGESPQPAWALALLSWYDMRTYGQPFTTLEEIPAWAQSCLKHAESIHDPQAIAASLVLLGAYAEDANDFKTAIRHYKKAMRIYPLLDDVYWVNIRIGLCHQSARQYPEAIRYFQMSLQRGKETGERLKKAWALANIGDTLLCQGNPQEAKCNLEKACSLFQEIGNKFGLVWSNFSLSKAAVELGNTASASEHAEIAGRLAQQLHAVTWVGKVNALLQEIDASSPPSHQPAKDLATEGFSQRELEVLQLLKSDLTGPEIADRLVISLNTVRFHTKNIYQKLGVNNRLEAIRRARELGL